MDILRTYNHFHFVGIGGVSMSALAKYLLQQNKQVSGSDKVKSSATITLQNMGAKIYYNHSKSHIKEGMVVVYSSAIDDKNPELLVAIKKGLIVIKRSELLGLIVDKYTESVAICGSHGKTTTTAMLGSIMISANLDPTIFLGGESLEFGNFRKGKTNYCVLEACEYKQNFLDIRPKYALVLNIDNDHLDTFSSIDNEIAVFNKFVKDKISFINCSDPHAKKLSSFTSISFGLQNNATFTGWHLRKKDNAYSFTVKKNGIKLGRINLKVKGKHNVYNAVACVAVATTLNIPFKYIKDGLEKFESVKRRCEKIGELNGKPLYCDYAHHPTEITNILKCFDEDYLVVFQPHTYSRTQTLLQEFVNSLKRIKRVIIYKTYPARERFNRTGSAKTLYNKLKVEHIGSCTYIHTKNRLKEEIEKEYSNYKGVIFIGAGDIYNIANDFVLEWQKGR